MAEPRYKGRTVRGWIDAVRAGKVSSPEAIGALRDGRVGPKAKSAVPFLIQALDDHTEGIPFNVRYVAAFVLERIGASAAEAVPALKKRVLEDADSICIISAAEALLRIGPKKSGVTFWKGILTHEDMSVARTAADALRRIGPAAEDAVDALFGALSSHVIHGLPQVYTFAAAALLKVAPSDPRLVGELKRGIGISNYGFQKTAIEGLVEIGSDEAYDVLRHLFDHMHAASPLTPPLERLITKVLSRVPGLKIQPRTTAPCPHCGAVLRSPRAKQCFECGADWHASSGASDRS